VTITAQPGPSSTCADAIKVIPLDEPIVYIEFPYDYYLQSNPDLTVTAGANNLQTGWKVEFVLDMGAANEVSSVDSTEPYEASFSGLSAAEHTIDAFVITSDDELVPGAYTHDRKIQIGIGEAYVAVGDSITEGYGDDDYSDDISEDGRNRGGGYEPVLNDLLTNARNIPHSVINEGVGGYKSVNGRYAIDETLAKHPEAETYLVQYGTNDAIPWLPVPSGLGLNPDDPDYPGTYKDNMQYIVDAINSAGKEACLAKIPIALGDDFDSEPYADPEQGARNILIREYNQVIDELISDPGNSIVVPAPDFYGYFGQYDSGTGRYIYETQYFDNLHPNGFGYQSMGDLWFDSLIQ
jgi:lysophospholipase L1-like esterase